MWWPLSARLAMSLIHHGCRVVCICPPEHPLRFVAGVEHLYPYRAIDSFGALKSAIEATKPDIIVPCDDAVVWQLHALHAQYPELRPLIEDYLSKWREAGSTVLKADGTWGGTGVEIAHSPDEALAAFRRLARPYGAGLAL